MYSGMYRRLFRKTKKLHRHPHPLRGSLAGCERDYTGFTKKTLRQLGAWLHRMLQ